MASERARQKKLERKRRKREERRRALRAETGSAEWGPPPMSLLLKIFAEPLLDRLPDKTNPDDWKVVLSWAAMVWNAATDGEAVSERTLTLGQQLFESFEWGDDVAEQVALLRARREMFRWEHREVARVDVEDRGDRRRQDARRRLERARLKPRDPSCSPSAARRSCSRAWARRRRSDEVQPTTRLGDWYANLLFRPGGQVVLFVNERTLLPVLVAASPASSLVTRFPVAAADVLCRLSVPAGVVEAEEREMLDVRVGKGRPRSARSSAA